MFFSKSEQNAIAYVVEKMLYYGSGSMVETATAHSLLYKVGYDPLCDSLPDMIFQDAINVIKPMPLEKKKAVLAIFANIMVADGETKKEKSQWLNTVTHYCAAPTMTWDETWEIIDSLD